MNKTTQTKIDALLKDAPPEARFELEIAIANTAIAFQMLVNGRSDLSKHFVTEATLHAAKAFEIKAKKEKI